MKKCIPNGKWYSYNPYELKCKVCQRYWPEDDPPPECRGFDESKIHITAAQWKLLDTANPAFMPADRSKWIEWQKADYKILKTETSEAYWKRVREDLQRKRNEQSVVF